MFQAIFEYQFLQHAVLACLLASVLCGIMGVMIVEKKLVMMSGGIAHTAYGGVGLGYLVGFEPIFGALLFSILAALGIGHVKGKGGVNADIMIGLFWSFGMALGIIFIGMMPGYPPDINSYLFGNILSVTSGDLIIMFFLTIVIFLVVVCLFQDWKAYLFDPEFSKLIGVPVFVMENLLMILIAVTVVMLIRVAGIILVLALLTAPGALAGHFSNRLSGRIYYAILYANVFSFAGLWISYEFNIPSGATIVVLAALGYFIVSKGKEIFSAYNSNKKVKYVEK